MTSPAKQHFLKTIAASAALADSGENRTPANANEYELMLVKLSEDRRRLSQIQSMQKRAETKRELLPDYGPWIQGVLLGNQGVQDDVLVTIMLWSIDAGLIAEALPLAAYAIQHKLKMPDQYKRKLGVVVAEEIADYYLKAYTANEPIDAAIVKETVEITEAEDMPDEVKAKLYKALGYGILGNYNTLTDNGTVNNPNSIVLLHQALQTFNDALLLNEKVGVKKDIEALERLIKNLTKA